MGAFLDGLKNLFKKPSLPALGIGLAVGTLLAKKSSHNDNIFGFRFNNEGHYDAYIESGRSSRHHRHHGSSMNYREYKDYKDFQKYQNFLDYKYGDRDYRRYNHCSMRDIQTRPYEMRRDCDNGHGGLAISTGDDGNIFIGGDLSGKRITIYN